LEKSVEDKITTFEQDPNFDSILQSMHDAQMKMGQQLQDFAGRREASVAAARSDLSHAASAAEEAASMLKGEGEGEDAAHQSAAPAFLPPPPLLVKDAAGPRYPSRAGAPRHMVHRQFLSR
jgi:hypothetical protein